MMRVDLKKANLSAVAFATASGYSDEIVIPPGSTVTVGHVQMRIPKWQTRIILWNGGPWALNGKPQSEPGWKPYSAGDTPD